MSLPQACIRRPVTVLMFYAGLLLFGVISLTFLPQELFPPITYPKLSIVTHYENAAPEEIETLITKPIEEAVGSTGGLRGMTSISREGLSVVVAEFGWNQRMEFAALDVREKIDLMKARLPRDAQEPTVLKFNPFEKPVMTLSISSDQRSAVDLKRFVERWFKDEIEKVNGVASATISGGADEEILVELDQGRLKATGLGVQDVSKSLSASNLNYPGGTIKESFYEYLVRTMGEFRSVEDVGKIVVGPERPVPEPRAPGEEEEGEKPDMVLLKDIAEIRRQEQERTSFSRYQGRESVTLSVQKQATANTIQVADAVFAKLKELQPQIPEDIHRDVVYNEADFIKDAIHGVKEAAIQGAFLAFVVLLVFLRRALLSLLVVVITPVTVITTFTVMYFMGISLNIISLGGIALCVGLLVDSAIVVIENVFRRLRENPGSDFRKEVALACDEVLMPLLSSTLTTVVVFLPMIFVLGIVGQLVKDLALVVVIMLLISFAVAFTLLPVLITRFGAGSLAPSGAAGRRNPPWLERFLDTCGRPLDLIRRIYGRLLPAFLKRKGTYLVMVLGVFIAAVFMAAGLDRIVMPKVDQGQFMMKIAMPVGTRVEVTNRVAERIERYLNTIPEVDTISVVVGSSRGTSTKEAIQQIGSHEAQIFVNLKPRRLKSTERLVQDIRSEFQEGELQSALKGGSVSYVLNESLFQTGEDETAPVVVNIKGNDMAELKRLTGEVSGRLEKIRGIFDVTDTFPESSPETKIEVDKDKASFYRLSVTDLATAAFMSIRGIVSTKLKEEGREIPIRVVVQKDARESVSKLPFLLMHSPLGISVPLGEVVDFRTGRGPSEIRRIGQERTVQVFAKIYRRSLSDVTADVEKALKGVHPPEGYHLQLAGAGLEVEESFKSLQLALILSVILVYMIMAAQFESYFQPFIIMFTLPLAVIGVIAALVVTGTPISVIVLLGVMFLGGIVVNNGIILIDFVNQMVRRDMSDAEAVIQAGLIRFRPILMTALTSVLGLLPLALGLGKGVKLLSPMGIAQMGGLFVSTFLTLLVIPAVYLASVSFLKKVFSRRQHPAGEAAPRT